MRPDADLSIGGLARLVAALLDRLDLHDVTLVLNDWGGPQLLGRPGPHRAASGLVLAACEAFDNFPPGTAGRQLGHLGRVPGGTAGTGRPAWPASAARPWSCGRPRTG